MNAISHFTDWTIAHVHIGALGWNGFLTFGILYYLVPRLWNTQIYSKRLGNIHFWLGTLGIVMYAVPLYFAGFTQSLMWKEFTPDGTLAYPNFLNTVTKILGMYELRSIGGTLYLVGTLVGVYNLIKTAGIGKFIGDEEAEAPALEKNYVAHGGSHWHHWIERRPIQFTFWALIVVVIGGLMEIVPTFLIKSNIPTIASVKPYTPLELQGRDIYVREGCSLCHSQMVRPFRSETVRYGEYSKAGEFVYDHPFLWGSKRTGPDLAREGKGNQNYKPDSWHYTHLLDPQSTSTGSIMPAYTWLNENVLDNETLPAKIRVMQTLGVPYSAGYDKIAVDDLKKQANGIAKGLQGEGFDVTSDKEIIALIAYLQRLGADINVKPTTSAK